MLDKLLVLIFFLGPPIGVGVVLLLAYFNNKFTNDSPTRKWLVLRNVITSEFSFVREGTVYRMPWWKLDTEVLVNKEETSSPLHVANAKFGGEINLEARWNILTGRRFDPTNGQIIKNRDADGNEVREQDILEDVVLDAITKTKFADRASYVAEVVSVAIDYVIGQYTFDQLTTLSAGKGDVSVPPFDLNQGKEGAGYTLMAKKIEDRGQFLVELARYLEHEINYRLRHVGFNVDEVDISQLSAASRLVQEDLDRSQQLLSRKRAKKEYEGENLSDREKLADIKDLPQVAEAEAKTVMANAIKDGVKILADVAKDIWGKPKT